MIKKTTQPFKSNRLIEWIIDLVIHRYLLILLLAIIASYYSFTVAKNLKLDTNITSLMPKGVHSVDNLKKVIDKAGGYSSAMVIVRSSDLESSIEFLTELRKRVLEYDWVSGAEFSEDISIFERHRLLYMETEDLEEINRRLKAKIAFEKKNLQFSIEDTPIQITIRGNEIQEHSDLDFKDIEEKYSKDGKKQGENEKIFRNDRGTITILAILPKGQTTNVSFSKEIIGQIAKEIENIDPERFHPQMSVQIGGRVSNLVAKFEATKSDVTVSAGWSIGGIFLVVILFYRRLLSLIYIGLPLVMGFLWTFMFTEIVLGRLNLVTVFLTLVIFGLGIDFGIHNFSRYNEMRANGSDVRDALRTLYLKTGHASLLAGITTMVGFYSVMVSDFRAFYEFGFIAGTGVAFTLISMYTVFPALMVFSENIGLYRIRNQATIEDNPTSTSSFPYVRSILILAFIISAISAIALPNLGFEDDFSKLEIRVPSVIEKNAYIREVFPLHSDKAIVFVENLEDVKAVVEAVEKIKKRKSKDPTIKKIKSIYSIIPSTETQRQRLEIIDQIHTNLSEVLILVEQFDDFYEKRKSDIRELLKFTGISELKPIDLPLALSRVYSGVPGSGGYLVYIYNNKGVGKFNEAQEFVNDVRKIEANGKVFYSATPAMVFVDMLNLMKRDAITAVIAVLITIFVVLMLVYRNIVNVLIILTPVCIGMLWMLGILAWFDIRLNIINMVVLPSVLGIGIDNGIHIFHRYREEGSTRVRHIIRTTGGAAFLTTLTTILGFAGTLMASHAGLQSLGLVACIGLGTCMLGSLTVLPALLQVITTRRQNTKTQIPTLGIC